MVFKSFITSFVIIFSLISTARAQSYPIHIRLTSSTLSSLKKSDRSIILKRVKPGCLWTNSTKIKVTSNKTRKYKVLSSAAFKKLIGSRNKITLKRITSICKKKTNDTRRDFTFTPTPTPTDTPKNIQKLPTPCVGTTGACPQIFSLFSAQPGDVLNIPGGIFSTSTSIQLQEFNSEGNPIEGSRITLAKVSDNPALIQVKIPETLTMNIWALWASQNDLTSEIQYINKPKITHISEYVIASGDELSIWGQMLSASEYGDFQPSVHFVSDTQTLIGNIIEKDRVKLKVIVPAGITPGMKYRISVSNGLANNKFRTESTQVTGQASTPDPYGLKVWWANEISYWGNVYNVKTDSRFTLKAVGNGLTDDTSAIQAAINYVGTHGGGVLYFPAGTYRTRQALTIKNSNVALVGASASSATITYGEVVGGVPTEALYFADDNVQRSGVINLTFRNLNASGIINPSIGFYWKNNIKKIFLKGITLDLGAYGEGLSFHSVSSILLSDCNLISTLTIKTSNGRIQGPVAVSTDDVIIRNNHFTYNTGRVVVTGSTNLQMIGNQITRNGAPAVLNERKNNDIETGNVEFGFTINSVFDSNTFEATQAIPEDGYNDGEMLMSQVSIYGKSYQGEISTATTTSITDNTRTWITNDITSPFAGNELYVAIVRGPGVGQSSKIVGFQNHTLQLDPETPFKIVPTNESSYIVTQWNVDNTIIVNNRFQYGRHGILIYDGGRDINIFKNTLTDAAEIYIRAQDLHPGNTNKLNRYPGWNVSINKNINQSTIGLLSAIIKVNAEQFVPMILHGNTVLNVELRDNTIISSGAPSHGLFDTDGYLYVSAGGAGTECNGATFYSDYSYASLGTVLSGNVYADQNNTNVQDKFYQSRCTYNVDYTPAESPS